MLSVQHWSSTDLKRVLNLSAVNAKRSYEVTRTCVYPPSTLYHCRTATIEAHPGKSHVLPRDAHLHALPFRGTSAQHFIYGLV